MSDLFEGIILGGIAGIVGMLLGVGIVLLVVVFTSEAPK